MAVQFIGHGAERVAARAEFTEPTERPLFVGVRFERAAVAGELRAEGDPADALAARLLDRERRARPRRMIARSYFAKQSTI
jgi:hypothetical protein